MQISKKALSLLIASVAVLAMVGTTGFVVYQVYFKVSENGPGRAIASSLDLPAARVGGMKISYADYADTMDAVRKFINSEAGKQVGSNMPPENELKKNVLDRLVRQAVVQEYAGQHNITVADDDVRKVFADVVRSAASSSIPDVAQYLYKNYGWNEEQFRVKVLRPALLEQKVTVELSKAKEGDANAFETYLAERLAKPDVATYIQLK